MDETISKLVAIFRESPTSSDDEIYCRAVAAGIESRRAARLVEFLPMAYCRLILAGIGIPFSDAFRRRQSDGSLSREQALSSDPLWAEIMSFVREEQAAGVIGADVVAIASHSAQFAGVNQLLNRGSKPENIVLTAAVFLWPEEGPTL